MKRTYQALAILGSTSLGLLASAGLIARNSLGTPSSSSPLRRRLQEEKPFGRPIIYTFFNPLLEDAFVTEMSPDGDAALVEVWKELWTQAGFEPRVLTLADAKKHDYYIPVSYMMEHTLLDGYNKMCILRWLAMSAVGGGWMSDYDTFPIRSFADQAYPLPNDGALTVHDRMIPDLVSGSANEYLRIAQNIVEDLIKEDKKVRLQELQDEADPTKQRKKKHHRTYTRWSDQASLAKWLEKVPDMFKSDTRVLIRAFDREDEVLGQRWSPEKCRDRTPENIWAVHFSHEAIKRAVDTQRLHPGQTMDHRAEIAREWVQSWKTSCGTM